MEGADLLLQIGYLHIYIYIYISLYHYISKTVLSHPKRPGLLFIGPICWGYVSIAPWCHEAASAKAPKAWWQRWKGGEGTNRSGTSPWKMEVLNGWFSIAMFQYGTVSLFPSKDTRDFSHDGKPLDSRSIPWKKQHTTWVALAGYFAPGLWPTTASTTITLKEGYIIPMKMLLWSHLHRGQGSAEISSHRLQLVIT